jgi:hypothetical protein
MIYSWKYWGAIVLFGILIDLMISIFWTPLWASAIWRKLRGKK